MRLDTFPMGGSSAGTDPSLPPTLSCLLQSGALPPSQSLEVWVGGVPQQAHNEGGLAVFSWQCEVDVPIEIHLKHEGRTIRAWRGWWKGDIQLSHTGTLALQVFCAGQPQPAGLSNPPPARSSPNLSVPPEHRNGSAALAIAPAPASAAVLDWPKLAETLQTRVPPPVQGTFGEDDLWSRAALRETEAAEEALEPDGEEEELGEEEFEEEETTEVMREEQAAGPTLQAFAVPDVPVSSPPLISAPAGTIIAAAQAAQVWSQSEHERVVKGLEAALASLPVKTILVDLRQHAPTPRTSRAARSPSRTMGLTKEFLRTRYGARYWDHGTQLPTSRRREPGRSARWSLVVDQSASEGLAALVIALEQGFSLLLLDSVAAYAESSRAAVLAALCERVSNLEIGPCA